MKRTQILCVVAIIAVIGLALFAAPVSASGYGGGAGAFFAPGVGYAGGGCGTGSAAFFNPGFNAGYSFQSFNSGPVFVPSYNYGFATNRVFAPRVFSTGGFYGGGAAVFAPRRGFSFSFSRFR